MDKITKFYTKCKVCCVGYQLVISMGNSCTRDPVVVEPQLNAVTTISEVSSEVPGGTVGHAANISGPGLRESGAEKTGVDNDQLKEPSTKSEKDSGKTKENNMVLNGEEFGAKNEAPAGFGVTKQEASPQLDLSSHRKTSSDVEESKYALLEEINLVPKILHV